MSGSLVHRLPDSYAKPVKNREKETATNTWKLFAVNEFQTERIASDISMLYDQLDLHNCTGASLDLIGRMYNIPREEGVSDDVYRTELLAKISGYFSGSSVNQVLQSIATACKKPIGTLYFIESSPAMVTLHIRSLKAASSLPVTLEQLKSIIENILPVGVGLEEVIIIDEQFKYCTAGKEDDPDLTGTGYNEPSAGLGSYQTWKGDTEW